VNELLLKRLERKLATLPEERLYQVLDYIEFLESKYAARSAPSASPLQRIAETVEDTLRAGKVPVAAIRGAMDVVAGAGRLVEGLAAAGKAVVEQVAGEARPPAGEGSGAAAEGGARRPAPPPEEPPRAAG
jgi:hypothetical protein